MSSSTYFNGYNFIVNSFVLEKIHSYNLSLNEFLLLMYFLNTNDKHFVITDLKKSLKLSKEEILSSLNVLIEKGILFLETKKDDNGVIQEYVSLAKFFELLDHNDKLEDEKVEEIKKHIKDSCNYNLSDLDNEIIKAWIEKGFDVDLIKKSIDESIYNGSFDIRYIDNLLYNKDINNKKEEKKPIEPLFDYNWLEDDKN